MKPSSGDSAPTASMSRSETSREVSVSRSRAVHAVGPVARAVDERAAVRRDEVIDGDGRHDATAAGTSPSSSSFATTSCADSSGECASVSITSSGFAGASYGSSTPVKPLISPANAFS